jgi:hypothetical protein
MIDELSNFEAAKEYLKLISAPSLETFFPFAKDPFSAYTIIKETENIMMKQLREKFPLFPNKFLPKCRFRMHSVDEDKIELEYNVQHYLNKESTMKYLGSCGIGETEYDLYCRHTINPSLDIMFISKYGHGEKDLSTGSRTAEAEYQLGIVSPLSVAYGMAIQDGIISKPLE